VINKLILFALFFSLLVGCGKRGSRLSAYQESAWSDLGFLAFDLPLEDRRSAIWQANVGLTLKADEALRMFNVQDEKGRAFDSYGRPYRVILEKDGIRLWGVGPNGIDEHGKGDDVARYFFPS
jgi:hypothetical protein